MMQCVLVQCIQLKEATDAYNVNFTEVTISTLHWGQTCTCIGRVNPLNYEP